MATTDRVALAHTRLSIIDVLGGQQPLLCPDGRLAAVVNGEIYNHPELSLAFAAKGCKTPRTLSDCESLMLAYATHGIDGFKLLHGMYAGAIHDRAHDTVTLVRDRLGIKPLYYTRQPGFVAFASELKALLPLLDQTPPLRADAITQFLEHEFAAGTGTPFEGIERVPPGTAITFDANLNARTESYWNLRDVQPVRLSEGEALERFTPLMEQVMVEHMRADVPFGLFLSGGVDSSLLCGLLTRLHPHPIDSFSVGYTACTDRNELDAAEQMAKRFGTRHHALVLSSEAMRRRLVHTVWLADELMDDHATLPLAMLAQHAQASLKVVFCGEGGDEVFAGYARYRKHAVQRWLSAMRTPGSGGFRTRSLWSAEARSEVFGPRLKREAGGFQRAQADAWRRCPRNWSALQKCQHGDLVTALPDNLLVKSDRGLMGFGLEGRVPFLDHRIVEFGLSLPDSLKVRQGMGKYFLRQWGLSFLPREHLFATKKGFHVPVGDMLSDDFVKRLMPALARNEGIRAWFDVQGVQDLLAAHLATHRHADKVWSLLHFGLWHRQYVEQAGHTPPLDADPIDHL